MIELFINGTRADLDRGSVIALSVAANKMQDIKTRSGVYSNKVALPLTQRNLLLMDNINQVTTASEFDRSLAAAELKDNGSTYIIGYISLLDITDKININVLSGNTEWYNLINNKLLSELDYSDLNHSFTTFTVEGNRNNIPDQGFVYANANYGAMAIPAQPYSLWDFYPSIYFPFYLKQLFKSIGYTVKGTLLDDDRFQRTTFPFVNLKMFTPVEAGSPLLLIDDVELDVSGMVLAGFSPLLGIVSAASDPVSMITTGAAGVAKFTPVSTAAYRYTAVLEFVSSGTVGNVEFVVFNSTTGVIVWSGSAPYVNGANTISMSFNTPVVNGASELRFALNTPSAFSVLTFGSARVDILTDYDYHAYMHPYPGEQVIMSQAVPDGIKQQDFIAEVFNRFGVIATCDVFSKTVTLNKFSDLYANIPKAVDLSRFIDTSQRVRVAYSFGDYSQKNWFRNKEDEVYPAGYGDGSLDIDKPTLPSEGNVFESKFAPTYSLYYPNLGIAYINIRAPFKKSIPRIATVVITDYNIVPMYGQAPQPTNANLTFDELKFDTAILPAYYNEQGDIIRDQKIYTVPIRLTSLHIAELCSDFEYGLSFNIPVFVDMMVEDNQVRGYFYLNDIKQFISDEASTDVELVRLLNT